MRIQVTISDLPPKKDGLTAMWGKTADLPRLKRLRRVVKQAIGPSIPEGRVSLTLRLFAEIADGDLDTFVSGVCDGLMAAHRETPSLLMTWTDEPEEVGPRQSIAYENDRWISRIDAERFPVDADGRRYTLTLDWLIP